MLNANERRPRIVELRLLAHRRAPPVAGTDSFARPDPQRRFRVMADVEGAGASAGLRLGEVDRLPAHGPTATRRTGVQRPGACLGLGRYRQDHRHAPSRGASGARTSGDPRAAGDVLGCAGRCATGASQAPHRQRGENRRASQSAFDERHRAAPLRGQCGPPQLGGGRRHSELLRPAAAEWCRPPKRRPECSTRSSATGGTPCDRAGAATETNHARRARRRSVSQGSRSASASGGSDSGRSVNSVARADRRKTGQLRARRAPSPAAGRPARTSAAAGTSPPSKPATVRSGTSTPPPDPSGARRMRCRSTMRSPRPRGTGSCGGVTPADGGPATQRDCVRGRKRAGCGASRWPSVFSGGGSRWLRGCGFLRPARRTRVRRRRRWRRCAWRRSRLAGREAGRRRGRAAAGRRGIDRSWRNRRRKKPFCAGRHPPGVRGRRARPGRYRGRRVVSGRTSAERAVRDGLRAGACGLESVAFSQKVRTGERTVTAAAG